MAGDYFKYNEEDEEPKEIYGKNTYEKDKSNFQYFKEEFEIVLVSKNFLVLKNLEGNNIKAKCYDTSIFSIHGRRFNW